MITLVYRRADGSFVAEVNGLPYHITEADPLFALAQEAADALGDDLGFEPLPEIPPPVQPYLNNGGLARFNSSPLAMLENIRIGSVSRLSKGRYRIYHEEPYPSDQYSASVSVFDPSPRTIRVTARTALFVEVRATDLAGAAQDPVEITVKTERVVTP